MGAASEVLGALPAAIMEAFGEYWTVYSAEAGFGHSDVQRSREILDELLRRAGERFRPSIERDYIERLLRRF